LLIDKLGKTRANQEFLGNMSSLWKATCTQQSALSRVAAPRAQVHQALPTARHFGRVRNRV